MKVDVIDVFVVLGYLVAGALMLGLIIRAIRGVRK